MGELKRRGALVGLVRATVKLQYSALQVDTFIFFVHACDTVGSEYVRASVRACVCACVRAFGSKSTVVEEGFFYVNI